MTLLSKTLNILGTLLLAHACYSAQEHSSHLQQTSSPSLLPADIILETLLSVITLCLGLVLGSPPLRPISWRVWAGKIENGGSGTGGEAEANPFLALESRVGFWDVRAKRREFEQWVRRTEGDVVVKS